MDLPIPKADARLAFLFCNFFCVFSSEKINECSLIQLEGREKKNTVKTSPWIAIRERRDVK